MERDKRIAKEDILRYLLEREGKSANFSEITKELKDEELARIGVEELEKEGMIHRRNGLVELTGRGEKEAKNIYERHVAIERVVGGLPHDIRHLVAHYIEHSELNPKQIQELGRSLRGDMVSLTSLNEGEEARLLAVLVPKPSLVARLYGVGLFPGSKLRVIAKSHDILLVAVGPTQRIVSIDRGIASHVLVVTERGRGRRQ